MATFQQQEVKHEKCKRCRAWRLPELFLNAKGRKLKTCQICRDRSKATRERNKCPHGRQRSSCKECGGGQICEHNRVRSRCKECKGGSICEHNRIRSQCKECGGGSICEHKRIRSQCKDCGGSQICEHNKTRSRCKECSGSQICEHNRIRSTCKECKGGSICEHNRIRTKCKECKGGCICEHGRIRSRCKECKGVSICEHNRIRSTCKECKGGSICEHNRRRSICKECDPIGHMSSIARNHVGRVIKNKTKSTKEYIGCSMEEFKEHISKQFKEGMSWDNYGDWHIDHIIPLKYQNPTMDELIERLHYTNTQPLWASENIAKGNKFIG